MPASPLYLRTRARLAQHLPQALASQLDTLGDAGHPQPNLGR